MLNQNTFALALMATVTYAQDTQDEVEEPEHKFPDDWSAEPESDQCTISKDGTQDCSETIVRPVDRTVDDVAQYSEPMMQDYDLCFND